MMRKADKKRDYQSVKPLFIILYIPESKKVNTIRAEQHPERIMINLFFALKQSW